MRALAGAAASNHRNGDVIAGARQQLDIEALARALAVDRGEQNLPGTESFAFSHPVQHIYARRLAAVVRKRLPAVGAVLLGLDRQHDGLAAERLGRFCQERRSGDRRGVDRHLVGSAAQGGGDVVGRAQAAADGQRHEDGVRRLAYDIEDTVASVERRHDIDIDDFVDTLGVVTLGELTRRADHAQAFQMDALDDVRTLDIEPGDEAQRHHGSGYRNSR